MTLVNTPCNLSAGRRAIACEAVSGRAEEGATRRQPPPPDRRIKRRAGRRRAYELRDVARRLLPNERICRCGRRAVVSDVQIRMKDGEARWSGLQTCGSVWQCPACSSAVAAERAEELRTMADRHIRAGGSIYMAAFTFSHKRWHDIEQLRRDVTGMWSKMIAGRRWQAMKAAAGCIGTVRALEVTHGRNGWHPHIHAIFALEGDDEDAAQAFGVELFERWDNTVQAAGYDPCNPAVWRFERAANYDAAADYVTKGAFDLELTRGHMKLAKGGGRSPWQLLEAAREGDRVAGQLFQQFARTFKGARQVTWSNGLKDRYGIGDRTDEEIAADEAGEVIGRVPARVFSRIAFKGHCATLLEAAEDGGWPAVVHLLKGWGLYWGGPPNGGEENGRYRAA